MSAGGIYLRQGDELIAMAEEPYASEAVLQKLLADHPDLLAGDQTGDEPRRWLFVSQEMSLASEQDGSGRWYVDHLFIDPGVEKRQREAVEARAASPGIE